MTAVDVRPVRSRRERRTFLTFPWRIYKDDPLWVPPLLAERAKTIDPARGIFHQRGEAEFFVARRGSEPVGTICAAEDPPTNEARGSRECVWGFFECIDDAEVAAALFEAAAAWGRRRGLDLLYGPYNLDYEDSYGILVEGRDRPPALMCGHTPEYYQRLVEDQGCVPARCDNVAFAYDFGPDGAGEAGPRRLARVAAGVRRRRPSFSVRGANIDDWDGEVGRIHYLLVNSLGHYESDFVPWRRDELESSVAPFRTIADPELILFAMDGDRTVGWLPGIPNLNEHFRRVNGLRHPWNYVQLAYLMRKGTRGLAVKSLLALPEYWETGVFALMFDEMVRRGLAKGYEWVDFSITSADNPQTPLLATRLGAKLYKRWRVYHRPI